MRWTKIEDFKSKAYGCKHTNYLLFEKWVGGRGITHYASRYSNFQSNFPDMNFSIELFDHVYFFKNDRTKEMWLTSQPYGTVDEIREKALKWCEENGLQVEFFDESQSWYYPGHTCLFVVTRN